MPTAIVTGAGKGIGRAIAKALAQNGYTVIANYQSSRADIESLRQENPEFAERLLPFAANVSKEEDCQALVEAALNETGQLDLLVNNAGITKDGILLRMTEADFQEVMDINAKGSFFMMKHAAKAMRKKRSGVIINMSSVSGVLGNAGQMNYAASKAAVIGMTKSAARELASSGIRVNAIAPGFIETRMTDKLSEKIKTQVSEQIPLKRFGNVENIAGTVLFLASDAANYITGVTLAVDGGMSMIS